MQKRIGDAVIVKNKERKFGSAEEYVFLRIQTEDGLESPLLFTANEIEIAFSRAKRNQEDLPKINWLQNLLD